MNLRYRKIPGNKCVDGLSQPKSTIVSLKEVCKAGEKMAIVDDFTEEPVSNFEVSVQVLFCVNYFCQKTCTCHSL